MLSALIAAFCFCRQQGQPGPNLVKNPDFARGLEGWAPTWSRKEGSTSTTAEAGRSGEGQAIHVKQADSQDWAVAQQTELPVKPRELYEISGWIKVEGGSANISVVSRDEKRATLYWDLGAVSPSKQGWQFVHHAFVTPAKCKSIQFRLIGSGVGETWLQMPSLTLVGPVPTFNSAILKLSGAALSLSLATDCSMLISSKTGKSWNYRPLSGQILIKQIHKIDDKKALIDLLELANDLSLTIKVEVESSKAEVKISYEGSGSMSTNVEGLGSIVTRRGDWVVLPMNEGIRFPVEDMTIRDWSLITYGGHGLCMPWSGVYEPNSGAGAMTIIETPNDADMEFRADDGFLTFQPRWEPSRQSFGYARRLRMAFFDHGGFVAMAKRYRTYAKANGLFKTLAAKRVDNPNVDRLIGAVNIWNWDMDKVALCKEMKQMGFERVLWSGDGKAEEIRAIANMGYLPGRYDIYQDVWDPAKSLSWMNTIGWPKDLVIQPDGEWMKGWAHPDKHSDGTITWYQGGVISSGPGLERAKEKIPADLAKIPYMARFIDTTTASPFREDYNPLHPLTRGQDRQNKMALLSFCSKDMKLVTGTETGIDPSVPVVEYYEGMMSLGPFRLPDAGTFMMEYRKPTPEFLKYQIGPVYRIPLWELVYHDCTVAQWYWGDASNKAPEVWDQRDLLNILYGTAPLLMFDKERWQRDKVRMLQTYKNVCEWTRKIGYDEMVSHSDLTPDHAVQMTTWSSGRKVIVNFSDRPYRQVKPKSFQITNPH